MVLPKYIRAFASIAASASLTSTAHCCLLRCFLYGTAGTEERECKRSAKLCKSLDSFLDIIEAYTLISATKEVYQKEREKVEEGFKIIYEHSVRVASHVGVDPSMPRIAKWQQHRSNAPAECPFEYYKNNVAIPFLDHILFNLDSRFSPLSTTATSLLTLVPAIICARNVELDNAIQVYHDVLPSPELVPQEIIRWKLRYENLPLDKRPSTVAAAIKECDPLSKYQSTPQDSMHHACHFL